MGRTPDLGRGSDLGRTSMSERAAFRSPFIAPASGIVPLGPARRHVLRVSAQAAAAVGHAGLFDLSGAINSALGTRERFAARLGPDEWLLLAPEEDASAGRVAADLGEHFHSLVDVSHRHVAIAVRAAAAPMILNAGVPLDLHDRAFPPGSATRTVLAKAEIVLVRWSDGFRVECARSFAPYVHAFLVQAALECGAT